MSVIIPGMDLPGSCNHCELNDGVKCNITGESWNWGMARRKSNCPLKSVDGLIEKIKDIEIEPHPNGVLAKKKCIDEIKEYCGEEQ